jgi:hypothetical protein
MTQIKKGVGKQEKDCAANEVVIKREPRQQVLRGKEWEVNGGKELKSLQGRGRWQWQRQRL